MEEKDRKLIEKVYLYQPTASYEGRPDKSADAGLPWNPILTAKYQTKFFEDSSDLVLNRAWQEIPGSILVGLLEQIRTRVLRFRSTTAGETCLGSAALGGRLSFSSNACFTCREYLSTAATFSLRWRTPPSQ
jgi:hypothetical protein